MMFIRKLKRTIKDQLLYWKIARSRGASKKVAFKICWFRFKMEIWKEL